MSMVATRRRGVSLLEVLFSTGVILIGMLGIMSVVPVAMQQIGKGRILDQAARVGNNAIHDFVIRGFHHSNRWRNPDGSAFVPQPPSPNANLHAAFAIDPVFVTQNGANVSAPFDTRYFPFYQDNLPSVATALRMRRLNLFTPGIGAMTIQEADRIFLSDDDLTFEVPEEETYPPSQVFVDPLNPDIRLYEGSLSWMATLAPLDIQGTPSLYRLSVIIFHGRTFPRLPALPPERYMERLIPSVSIVSGAAGGEATLRVPNDRYEDLVDIDAGQWLMLMGSRPAPLSGGDPLPLFRWYRILHADSEPVVDTVTGGSTPPWLLDVTLDGADWPAGLPTQAVFVPNIVHIRERTVRLSVN
jgi:hypothetical protein